MKPQPVRAPKADPCRYLPPSRACRESSGFVDTPSFFVPTVNISFREALVRFESSSDGVLPPRIINSCLPCAIGVLPSQGTVPPSEGVWPSSLVIIFHKCWTPQAEFVVHCNPTFLRDISPKNPVTTGSYDVPPVCGGLADMPYIRFLGDPRCRKHPKLPDLN